MALQGTYDDSVSSWRERESGCYFVQTDDWTGFILHMTVAVITHDSSAHVIQLRITTANKAAIRVALYRYTSFPEGWTNI